MSTINPIIDDSIPTRLPHFHLKDGSLYYLISRRPHASLNEEQQAAWNMLDGVLSAGALRARQGQRFDAILKHFVELGVCTVIPGRFPASRKHVMVIEPHMDDAALSVGGTMWLRRNECEFSIVTLASISCFTTYFMLGRDYFDIDTVSRLRQAESSLVARLVGGRHIRLGKVEASLRYRHTRWTLDWYKQHAASIHAFRTHSPVAGEMEEWTSVIAEAISRLQPDEIWMPLGVGVHVDHQLVRDACLNIMSSRTDLLNGRRIKFFQDVPYAAMYPNHTTDITAAIRDAGATLDEEVIDVAVAMPHKLHLVSMFASQFKIAVMGPRVEKCAALAGKHSGGFKEVFYRVSVPPAVRIDSISSYAEKRAVYRVSRRLEAWFHRNKLATSIEVIMAVPVGRWAEDMAFLLDSFPKAVFEVHIPDYCLAETETLALSRIVIRQIGNRWRSWFRDSALASATRAKPLVLISGHYRENFVPVLRILSIGSNSVIAPTMNDFILALRLAVSRENKRSDTAKAQIPRLSLM